MAMCGLACYSLLPTAMLTVSDDPCFRYTLGTSCSVALGDRCDRSSVRRTAAAWMLAGNCSSGRRNAVLWSIAASADIWMPTLNPIGTAKPSSLPYRFTAGNPGGPFTFFHSANCNTESMDCNSVRDSLFWNTEGKAYSVPVNWRRAATIVDGSVNNRGDLIRLSSTVALVASRFAAPMSFSKESASLRALSATFSALPDSSSAFFDASAASPAFVTAVPDWIAAVFASCSASLASCLRFPINRPL